MLFSRRRFLDFMGRTTAASALTPTLLYLNGCASKAKVPLFDGIKPSFADEVKLIDGLEYYIVAKCGDVINKKGEVFGAHNDFNCFLPFRNKDDEALLWVNHESVTPQFLHNKNSADLKRSVNEIMKEQEMVGGSILHIKKTDKKWMVVKNSKYNNNLCQNAETMCKPCKLEMLAKISVKVGQHFLGYLF